jgi:hypothetical protein
LRQLVLAIDGLPAAPVAKLVACIDAMTASENGWTFVMLSPADNARVVSWLAENSTMPKAAMRLWANLFLHLQKDTGEIAQSREELAKGVDIRPNDLSRIMGELESLGAIRRDRVKVDGMRGPGVVRYFMNPRVGTHLAKKARDKAQAEAPQLRLVKAD